jgi:hypothetical protein
MRVMEIVKATEDSEQARMPSMELMAAMGKFNEDLMQAGLMLSGDGVKPTATGYRIAFDGDGRTVRPGPARSARLPNSWPGSGSGR